MNSIKRLSLCITAIILLCTSSCSKEQTEADLSSLPISLSTYIKDAAWHRNDLDTQGLPENVKHIRYVKTIEHTGEEIWIEVFAIGDQVLYVRRKIYYRPAIFGPTDLKVQTIVMILLEEATNRELEEFSSDFLQWLRQTVRSVVNGKNIDTRFNEKGISIRLRTEGGGLILECAPNATMSFFESLPQ